MKLIIKVEVFKLQILLRFIGIEQKLGAAIAGIRPAMLFELIFPFGNRFGVIFLEVSDIVADQMAIITSASRQVYQFSVIEIYNILSVYLGIRWSAPFFAGFQIDEPYFLIPTVQ